MLCLRALYALSATCALSYGHSALLCLPIDTYHYPQQQLRQQQQQQH